jgi:hypothetical protein
MTTEIDSYDTWRARFAATWKRRRRDRKPGNTLPLPAPETILGQLQRWLNVAGAQAKRTRWACPEIEKAPDGAQVLDASTEGHFFAVAVGQACDWAEIAERITSKRPKFREALATFRASPFVDGVCFLRNKVEHADELAGLDDADQVHKGFLAEIPPGTLPHVSVKMSVEAGAIVSLWGDVFLGGAFSLAARDAACRDFFPIAADEANFARLGEQLYQQVKAMQAGAP